MTRVVMTRVGIVLGVLLGTCGVLHADDGSGSGPVHLQWIEELGSEDFGVRRAASRRLVEAGEFVVPALRTAMADPDPERAARARTLVERILKPRVLERLQGDWRFVGIVIDGENKTGGLGTLLRLRDGTCSFVQNDGKAKYGGQRFEIDVLPEPVHFDLVDDKGQPTPGLIHLDGDELELTYSMQKGQARPVGIDPRRTKGLRYFRLKRVRDDDEPETTPVP